VSIIGSVLGWIHPTEVSDSRERNIGI
jgi:hypothetical protein